LFDAHERLLRHAGYYVALTLLRLMHFCAPEVMMSLARRCAAMARHAES